MNLPRLYARASTGKIKTWEIEVRKPGVIITQHGYVDGKITTTSKTIEKGKNIGKKNETTPYEQACSQALSTFEKKKDKKYVEDIDKIDTVEILKPMLALPFEKRKHNIVYPCYIQPKLDGTRCLASKTNNGIAFTSRNGKEIPTVDHLKVQLDNIMDVGDVLDGELYHPEWTFQQIIRRVKKVRDNSAELQYWIYDAAMPGTFEERFIKKFYFKKTEPIPIVIVYTIPMESEEEVMHHHSRYIQAGFEGTIIRNIHGLYKFNHRSADLQKHKDFLDAEFTIIGGKEGVGSDKGCVTFRVQNGDNAFDVRPMGTVEKRKKWFNELDSLIGKKLTVRYQNLSEDGVPIFPVGRTIRDYE